MCDNCNWLHLDSTTNSIAERSKKTRGEVDRLNALLPFCDVVGCHCLSCYWLLLQWSNIKNAIAR